MKVFRITIVWVFGLSLLAAGAAEAGKPINRPERVVVGEGREMVIVPDLDDAVRVGGGKIWAHSITINKAFFLKPHFTAFNLRAGDALVVRSATGHVVETITSRGPKDMGSFWGLSARGEELHLELHISHEYSTPPFRIDRVIVGDVDPFAGSNQGPETVCAPADFEDVICYDDDPNKWGNVMASVGVMSVGSSPTDPSPDGLWCSGSNVSPNNYVLTNHHCVANSGKCDTSEFVFKYYKQNCGLGPTTPDWVSFRCDDVAVSSPYVECEATLSTLDFTLNSVIGDPSSTFGFVLPDSTPITDGEGIYIIQHPDGRPHEITHGDGVNVDADSPNLRYYDSLDTESGSSGSPIYRESDDKLIGLHHCGGCTTAGTGNRGMMMSDIYPLIESYLCAPSASLWNAGSQGLAEVIGNGNAVLDPGEQWQFTPIVRNAGCLETALGATADVVLRAGSAGPVTFTNGSPSFGDIGAGVVAASLLPVIFEVDPAAACGESVAFDLINLTATNGGPYTGPTSLLSVPIGEPVFASLMLEDFSAGIPVDWTVVHNGSATGVAETWTTGNPGGRTLALTDPFAIVDSDNAGSGVTHDEELISPPVDCTGYPKIELRFNHDFNWFSSTSDEQGDVDIRSAATGGAWVTVANFSGGSASGHVVVDISAQAVNQTDVEIRFHYYDAEYDWWWAVDDIDLVGGDIICEIAGPIFEDDFESSDTSAWSASVP